MIHQNALNYFNKCKIRLQYANRKLAMIVCVYTVRRSLAEPTGGWLNETSLY